MPSATAKRRIGILGGMGPQATVLLMSRIIAATKADDDVDHVPMLVDNNTQVPSRIRALVDGTGEDPAPVLADMARSLQGAGVAALAMPCNTAHNYASSIRAAVTIPLIDMVELSADAVADAMRRSASASTRRIRVGILASPAVRLTGIFDRALAGRGLETVHSPDQDAILACIRAVKRNGGGNEARECLAAAATDLQHQGVAAIVVACSELSIIAGAISANIPVIDTIDVLADAVVTFASSGDVHQLRQSIAPPSQAVADDKSKMQGETA